MLNIPPDVAHDNMIYRAIVYAKHFRQLSRVKTAASIGSICVPNNSDLEAVQLHSIRSIARFIYAEIPNIITPIKILHRIVFSTADSVTTNAARGSFAYKCFENKIMDFV